MNKRCVISLATGRYESVLQRQKNSMLPYTGSIDHLTWLNELPEGCPTHQEVPYAFKSFCIQEAIKRGYTSILWLDSAVWVQGDLWKLFHIIEEEGHLIFKNGWNQANWSTDRQLMTFGYTRDQAEAMPHPMACAIGIKVDTKVRNAWHEMYTGSYPQYVGSWNNANNACSDDMRCLGSRHDQTILGFVSYIYKMKMTRPEGLINYDVTDASSILLSQGV